MIVGLEFHRKVKVRSKLLGPDCGIYKGGFDFLIHFWSVRLDHYFGENARISNFLIPCMFGPGRCRSGKNLGRVSKKNDLEIEKFASRYLYIWGCANRTTKQLLRQNISIFSEWQVYLVLPTFRQAAVVVP